MAREKIKNANVIARFHKTVLSWDYFRLLKNEHQQRNYIGNETTLRLKRVKETYEDIDEYVGTFEPLLFEEVKAHIVQRRDEDDDGVAPRQVLAKQQIAKWNQGVILECIAEDEFNSMVVGYDCEEGESIAENDLLLLCKDKIQETSLLHSGYIFAMVLNHEGRNHLKLRTGDAQLMSFTKRNSCSSFLKKSSTFTESDASNSLVWISKIASLSTIIREYVGLWSITTSPFKELLLSAAESVSNSEDRSWRIPTPLKDFLEKEHNASQMGAILDGVSHKSLVLIQGPPGTGKTHTILGLLSAVLHSTPARVHPKRQLCGQVRESKLDIHERYNHWKLASPWLYGTNPRDKIMPIDGDDGFFPMSSNEMKPELVNSNLKYRVRVLICAPSNSALDEIILRVLRTGINDEKGRAYIPKVVRIGLKPHHDVQGVSLDHLVEKKLAEMKNSTANVKNHGATLDRDSIRASILQGAAIVFSTLSFSGSSLFNAINYVFDVVIIDEAAQAVEPAVLVPLANGCKKLILVGDPIQLPATVLSSTAKDFGYDMSLFERFQKANYPVKMLKIQYRMHPKISEFPSQEFYDRTLEDGPDVKDIKKPWHVYRCFGPFVFFDISGVESKPAGSSSWVNVDEVDFILLIYQKLVSNYQELKSSSKLAIISPYGEQVKLFRERFRKVFGVESDKLVDISTVDGFQGRETDIAIFSCVRANENKIIGFLKDRKRMNVAITRAKSSVLVVGSRSTLEKDTHWGNLVKSAVNHNCLFKVSRPYSSFVSDENLKNFHVKDDKTMIEEVECHLEDMENMYVNTVGEHDQQPMDEDDYGYADGGDFDEDKL